MTQNSNLIIDSAFIFPGAGIAFSVHDLVWPRNNGQSFWPQFTDLKKIKNHLNIGMLHIKWKLKTEVLHWKYVQTSDRSNDWPRADLNWPLMTSKLYIKFIFNFQGPKRSREVKSWSWEVIWSSTEKIYCHKWYPWVLSFDLICNMPIFKWFLIF